MPPIHDAAYINSTSISPGTARWQGGWDICDVTQEHAEKMISVRKISTIFAAIFSRIHATLHIAMVGRDNHAGSHDQAW
jgi:hypothetical protein